MRPPSARCGTLDGGHDLQPSGIGPCAPGKPGALRHAAWRRATRPRRTRQRDTWGTARARGDCSPLRRRPGDRDPRTGGPRVRGSCPHGDGRACRGSPPCCRRAHEDGSPPNDAGSGSCSGWRCRPARADAGSRDGRRGASSQVAGCGQMFGGCMTSLGSIRSVPPLHAVRSFLSDLMSPTLTARVSASEARAVTKAALDRRSGVARIGARPPPRGM